MSVLVTGLPAIEAAQLPPLRAVEPKQVSCLQRSGLALPVDGAPLVFSTGYMHDVVLHVQTKAGLAFDLPATADATRGGFVIDTHPLRAGELDTGLTGTLHGYWGFQAFDGPTFQLQSPHTVKWVLASEDTNALIVGRKDAFHLQSETAPCVDQVTMKDQHGKPLKATWKLLKANQQEIEVPLKDESAGQVLTLVAQSGLSKPDEVPLQAYSEAAHLDHFALNAGDQQGVLTGMRLDEMAGLELDAIHFVPGALSRTDGKDELHLSTSNAAAAAALEASEKLVAHIDLKDGRVLDLDMVVEPPRPRVTLLNKSVQTGSTPSVIRFGNSDDLPQDGEISFFLKTEVPATFPRAEKIEVATDDGSAHVSLSLVDGSLVLEDSQTLMGTLQPLKSFGPSVFGALRFRAVSDNGVSGGLAAAGKTGAHSLFEGGSVPGHSRQAVRLDRAKPVPD